MATPVSNSFDWSSIYAEVQSTAHVPSTAETTRDGSRLIIRDLVVSLDTIIQAVETAPDRPLVVYVFADVVTLPADRNWALPPLALFIVARRIVATSGTFLQLDYRTPNNATLVLYASEIEGPLRVQAVTAASPKLPTVFDLTHFDSLGVQIRLTGGQAVQTPLVALPPELLSVGSPLWMSLSTTFEFASILIESRPDVARSILTWIQAASAPSDLLPDLGLQSAALLAQLTVTASGVHFVPYLSPSVYQDSATAFGDAAKQYESQYQFFSAQATSKEQWIASAQNMENVDDLSSMHRDYADALESFVAPPQAFGTEDGGVAIDITDPGVLNDLRTKGQAQFSVDSVAPAFAAYDRVRLSRLRVWLYGATGPAYVQIRTNGVYDDRLNGEGFKFTAAPLQRFFQYHGAPGDAGSIDGDGVVADEQRFAYFQPTPFTVWHIELPKSLNNNVDLSGLNRVAMTFSGSAIGKMEARA